MTIARIRKALAPPVIGLVAWWGDVIASKPAQITAREWRELGIIGAIALGVYAVPNRP